MLGTPMGSRGLNLMSAQDLPDPRQKSPQGINKYDKSKAEEWVKAGKIPPPPDFSADTHAAYRAKLAEVEQLARQNDLNALKRLQTDIEPKSSSRIAILQYLDLCIRAIETASKTPPPPTKALPRRETIMSLINGPTNLILYGPPGTGKTYATIEESVRLCDGTIPQGGSAEVKKRFNELIVKKRIEFVTFHQSYSYEEFLLGLRPDTLQPPDSTDTTVTGSLGFRLVPTPGVFYRMAKAAGANRGTLRSDEVIELNKKRAFKMSLGATWTDEGTNLFRECIQGNYVLLGWGGEVDWSAPEYSSVAAIEDRWRKERPQASSQDSNIRQLHRLRNVLKC
jgi:hypothetical protein